MKFLVIAHDHTDNDALVRRLVVRERHLAAARRAGASGNMLIGGTILDEWLQSVPYMKNKVWERIEVYPYQVAVMASLDPDETEPNGNHGAAPNLASPAIGKERR